MEIRVTTRDGTKHILGRKLYEQSILLRDLVDESLVLDGGVGILVDSDVFKKIEEFMASHSGDSPLKENFDTHGLVFTDFDEGFFLMIDKTMLFRIAAGANYLNMPLLLELCCSVIATSLKEASTEEIKKYLSIPGEHIKNEINVQKEYKWIE